MRGENTWEHQGGIFLITEPFCGDDVLLHSKSEWNVTTVKLIRINVVPMKEYFKLLCFGKAFKLRQYFIEFIVQIFLQSRKISANKEVCNSFLLSTVTQICVTVANLITVSIEIASTDPESAK